MTAAPRAVGVAASDRGATNVDDRVETTAAVGRAVAGRATAEPTKAMVDVGREGGRVLKGVREMW